MHNDGNVIKQLSYNNKTSSSSSSASSLTVPTLCSTYKDLPEDEQQQRQEEASYAREVKELLEWCERFNKGSLDNFN